MQLDYMGLNGDTRKGENTYDIERNKTMTMSCLIDFAFSMQTKGSLNQYVRIQWESLALCGNMLQYFSLQVAVPQSLLLK